MALASNGQTAIIRTERGLTIADTRITLYDVIDYLKAQYPPKFIRDAFNLTDAQIHAALSYIETHRTEVEAEYQEVLKTAAETKQFWEERRNVQTHYVGDKDTDDFCLNTIINSINITQKLTISIPNAVYTTGMTTTISIINNITFITI